MNPKVFTTMIEFNTKSYKVNEDVQSALMDSDLLSKAAQLEANKVAAKKILDTATKQYNDTCQQIDQQMVQLINTQAQRNGQKAKDNTNNPQDEKMKSINAKQENESEESLNEDIEGSGLHKVLLDTFLPQVLGLSYNDKYIQKVISASGLRCYNDKDNGLTVVLSKPEDLGTLFQIMEDQYLDEREYEAPILEQLPGEFTRAFYSGNY